MNTKTWMLLLSTATLFSTTSWSSEDDDLYLVDPMVCKGQLKSMNPEMADDYKNVTLTVTSMESVKKDGTRVRNRVIENAYISDAYGPPLRLKGTRLTIPYGNYDGWIRLEIKSSIREPGHDKRYIRTDRLEGNWTEKGTVVGDTDYKLACTAVVVSEVSRVDDATNGKWLKVRKEDMELAKSIAKADKDNSVYDLFSNGKAFALKDLKLDAKKVYGKANRETRYAEAITIEKLKVTLLHIEDASEGNGCHYMFKTSGEYLNKICGTESSEWVWDIK